MTTEEEPTPKLQNSETLMLLDHNEITEIEMEKHSGLLCMNYKWSVCLICSLHLMYQTVSGGLYGATVSTIEQRFQLQSTEIGIIAGILDISSIIGMIIVSIYGETINKPKGMSICAVLMSISVFIFVLPHFIAPSYVPASIKEINLCENITVHNCQGEENIRNFRFVFMASMAIMAISWTILYTLAIVYIDENTSADKSAFYTGLFYAMGGAGPALGFVLGGFTLQLYVNISEGLQIDSSGWIGNWWIGYLICSSILLISGTLVFFLPKSFPKKKFSKRSPRQENASPVKVPFTTAFKMIFTNKMFMLSVIGASVNFMFLNGFSTFGAKYIVSQYGLSPFVASLVFGSVAVVASVIAHVTSGIIISKLKLDLLGIIKYMVLCCVISTIFSCALFFHCPDEVFATDENSTSISMLTMQCNSACNCSTDLYEPVCGSDDVTYFSPCHAGCLTQVNQTNFSGCECVQEQQNIAMLGKCDSKFCMNFIWFLLVFTFAVFTSVLTVNPSMQVVLKTVALNCRVIAVSFYYGLTNIFGVLPGRIMTGVVVDLACKVWQTECGEQGSCVVYNRWEMSRNMTLTVISETSFMVLIYMVMLLIYKQVEKEANGNNRCKFKCFKSI